MKVLILGNFGKGALENFYKSGLEKHGAKVYSFDITSKYYQRVGANIVTKGLNKIYPRWFYDTENKNLLHFLKGKTYDVILVFKGLTLYPETIAQLKYSTKLVCCYNPDHPFKFFSEGSGNSNIKDSIRHYDIYFTYASKIAKELQQQFGANTYTIPFGFTNSPLKTIPKTSNESQYRKNWLFIGAYDEERSAFFKNIVMKDLQIYGEEKWRSRNMQNIIAKTYYQGRALYDEDYEIALRSSKGIINLLRQQNIEEGSHNMRTFEVPGAGGLLLAQRTEEQRTFFEEDKEAVFFDGVEEFQSKVRYLDEHPTIAEKIKQAGYQRARRNGYSYDDRSLTMKNLLERQLKQ